jgi:hypothetical protein
VIAGPHAASRENNFKLPVDRANRAPAWSHDLARDLNNGYAILRSSERT